MIAPFMQINFAQGGPMIARCVASRRTFKQTASAFKASTSGHLLASFTDTVPEVRVVP